jgi:precorrin-3B synthase
VIRVDAAAPPVREEWLDHCPGALSLHDAQDGLLARIRLPGGRIRAAQLGGLADLARSHAAGELELTSRANVQLRGITPGLAADLAARIEALGLLPSATHERVRNIAASPLAGVDRPDAGIDRLISELDERLCATRELSGLPGRFLFGLDDGRGDIAGLRPDAWAAHVGEGRYWTWPSAVIVNADEVVEELLAVAREFVRTCPGAWRIHDLTDGGARLAARTRRGRAVQPRPVFPRARSLAGLVARADGGRALAVQVPLGHLTVAAAAVMAATTVHELRITPSRGLVVPRPENAADALAAAHDARLVTGPSLWSSVTACIGSPGCAKALADVRRDAAIAVGAGHTTPEDATTAGAHWSGCERRCGSPASSHLAVVATGTGYDIRRVP